MTVPSVSCRRAFPRGLGDCACGTQRGGSRPARVPEQRGGSMNRRSGLLLLVVLSPTLCACNALTGAGDLVLDEPGGGIGNDGSDPSSTGEASSGPYAAGSGGGIAGSGSNASGAGNGAPTAE